MEMGRVCLTWVGPWLMLFSLRCEGSQGKKGPLHIILSHDGGKSGLWWVKSCSHVVCCCLMWQKRGDEEEGDTPCCAVSIPFSCLGTWSGCWALVGLPCPAQQQCQHPEQCSCLLLPPCCWGKDKVAPELQRCLWAFHRPYKMCESKVLSKVFLSQLLLQACLVELCMSPWQEIKY